MQAIIVIWHNLYKANDDIAVVNYTAIHAHSPKSTSLLKKKLKDPLYTIF